MTQPDDEPDEDAPAFRPEDLGEDPDTPSATHGDPHARPPLDEP
jgi:hypothetical protein